jgi:hypothetical protein
MEDLEKRRDGGRMNGRCRGEVGTEVRWTEDVGKMKDGGGREDGKQQM